MASLRFTATGAGLSTVLVLALACNSSRLVSPGDISRLVAAEAKWKSRPFADYRHEIRTACFCPPEVNRWTRVTVRNGAVVAAEAVEPDPDFPITSIDRWEPVDSLFAHLRQTLENQLDDSDGPYDAIIATYDPTLGFPTRIEYRTRSNILDGGMTHYLRHVQPLE